MIWGDIAESKQGDTSGSSSFAWPATHMDKDLEDSYRCAIEEAKGSCTRRCESHPNEVLCWVHCPTQDKYRMTKFRNMQKGIRFSPIACVRVCAAGHNWSKRAVLSRCYPLPQSTFRFLPRPLGRGWNCHYLRNESRWAKKVEMHHGRGVSYNDRILVVVDPQCGLVLPFPDLPRLLLFFLRFRVPVPFWGPRANSLPVADSEGLARNAKGGRQHRLTNRTPSRSFSKSY